MKGVLISMVQFYQKHISPARPPCCRFIPTCSAYALEALEIHGAWRGFLLALRRFLRCHPFHGKNTPIYDPVPMKKIR